jgi:dipeptidyl aminopeptidase/acylaminoacyl peptidase
VLKALKLGSATLAATVLIVLAPSLARASFPGADGVIAYEDEGSIWAVDPTTGDQLKLTSGPEDSSPSFSPSGNQLAFQRGKTIYVVQSDGTGARAITAGAEPTFSPDGTQIAFVRRGGLYVAGLAPGSPVRRLTNHPGDHAPNWSSRGTIVFQRTDFRHRGGGNVPGHPRLLAREELDVIDPPALRPRTLLSYSQDSEMFPDWSPNGATVTFALCEHVLDRGTRPAERLTGSRLVKTVPALRFRHDCAPAVWAPSGGLALAQAQVAPLAGREQTSCPFFVSVFTRSSWQPVLPGTVHVPTVPCSPESRVESAVEAAGAGPNEKLCIYSQRKRQRVCVRLA